MATSLERLRYARLCYILAQAYINARIEDLETREFRDYAIAGLAREVNTALALLDYEDDDGSWGPAARQIAQVMERLRNDYEKTGVVNLRDLKRMESLLNKILTRLANTLG